MPPSNKYTFRFRFFLCLFILFLFRKMSIDDVNEFSDESLISTTTISIQSIRYDNQCQVLQWMEHASLLDRYHKWKGLDAFLPTPVCEIVIGYVLLNEKKAESEAKKPPTSIPFQNTEIKITNIVCNASIQRKINLKLASCYLNNSEYCPQKSPCTLIMRTKTSSCIVSKNGNLKLMQCTSEESMVPSLRMFARKLQLAGIKNGDILDHRNLCISSPKIQTVSANVDLKFEISSLEKFAKQFEFIDIDQFSIIYDPEISSSLKIKQTKTDHSKNVNANIFASGKITFLGSKDISSMIHFMEFWYPKFLLFQKPNKQQQQHISSKREVEFVNPMNQSQFEHVTKKLKLSNLQKHFPLALAQLLCA